MSIKIISTKRSPSAIGPYSQAVCTGDIIYTSGQLPIDMETGEIVIGCIAKQSEYALNNLATILDEAGFSMNDVVKTTVFMTDLEDFATLNEEYSKHFTVSYPARSCVQVVRLPKDAKIEIEAIAIKNKKSY